MGPSPSSTQKPIPPTPERLAWKSTNPIGAKYVANATKTLMAWNTIKTTPSSATQTCRKAKDRKVVLALPMTQLYRPYGAWTLTGKWICSGLSWVLVQLPDSNSTFHFVWVIRNLSQFEYVRLQFQPNVFYLRLGGTNLFYKIDWAKNLALQSERVSGAHLSHRLFPFFFTKIPLTAKKNVFC